MSVKRIIVMGDPHCGGLYGLTPPAYQVGYKEKSMTKRNKWAQLQRQLWHHYDTLLKSLAPYHYAFWLGDMIDGDGPFSHGTELITTDRIEQCDMAVEVCDHTRKYAARGYKQIGVYGTAVHTGKGEDYEGIVAERAGWEHIGAHEWPQIGPTIFDIRHHLGGTSVSTGKGTQLAKQWLSNQLWAIRGEQPNANVYLRGHVHRAYYIGDTSFVAMSLPALSGMGSKFGSRRCDLPVDWGMVHFDIDDKLGVVDWKIHTVMIDAQVAKVTKM